MNVYEYRLRMISTLFHYFWIKICVSAFLIRHVFKENEFLTGSSDNKIVYWTCFNYLRARFEHIGNGTVINIWSSQSQLLHSAIRMQKQQHVEFKWVGVVLVLQ